VSERPFNFQRAVFWLVAFVIGAHVFIALMGALLCFVWLAPTPVQIINPRWKCDADNRLFDLLSTALSTALAFATGRWSASSNILPHAPPPPPPPTDKGGKA
jgi:hypothetical protein